MLLSEYSVVSAARALSTPTNNSILWVMVNARILSMTLLAVG
jgi:hypothetical protein